MLIQSVAVAFKFLPARVEVVAEFRGPGFKRPSNPVSVTEFGRLSAIVMFDAIKRISDIDS